MASKTSVYQRVTDAVLAELARGTAPWRKPWQAAFGLPRNLISRRPYHGVNTLVLMTSALTAGYEANEWLTFKQAKDLGGFVRRGEHGQPVVFFKQVSAGQDRDEETSWRWVLRTYTVFNAAQCADIAVPRPPTLTWEPVEAAERVVARAGVPIRYAGGTAYYSPQQDRITLPPRPAFDTVGGFYGTLLHELVHATGHESRLARPFGPRGSDAYAWEELIAELGSAMLSAVVGIPASDYPNIASYVDAWRRRMQRDARALGEAAAKAQKAADWLLAKAGLSLPGDSEQDSES
jgi:antirestriction protein ArdC